MDREGFRNRLKQYKKAREENPGLKYWEWKNIPKYDEGIGSVGIPSTTSADGRTKYVYYDPTMDLEYQNINLPEVTITGNKNAGKRLPMLVPEGSYERFKTLGEIGKTVGSFLPVVGEMIDTYDLATDIKNKDWTNTAIRAGGYFIPNAIEKFGGTIYRGIRNNRRKFNRNLNIGINQNGNYFLGEYLPNVSKRITENELKKLGIERYKQVPFFDENTINIASSQYKNAQLRNALSAKEAIKAVQVHNIGKFTPTLLREINEIFKEDPRYADFILSHPELNPLDVETVDRFVTKQNSFIRGVHSDQDNDELIKSMMTENISDISKKKGGDRLGTNSTGIYVSNSGEIADRFQRSAYESVRSDVALLYKKAATDINTPIKERLAAERRRIFPYDIVPGSNKLSYQSLVDLGYVAKEAQYTTRLGNKLPGYERAYISKELDTPNLEINDLQTTKTNLEDKKGRWGIGGVESIPELEDKLFDGFNIGTSYGDYLHLMKALKSPNLTRSVENPQWILDYGSLKWETEKLLNSQNAKQIDLKRKVYNNPYLQITRDLDLNKGPIFGISGTLGTTGAFIYGVMNSPSAKSRKRFSNAMNDGEFVEYYRKSSISPNDYSSSTDYVNAIIEEWNKQNPNKQFAEGGEVTGPPTYEQWNAEMNQYSPTILDDASLYWSLEAAKKDLHKQAMSLPGYAPMWHEYVRSLPKADPDINQFVDDLWANENPNNVGYRNGKYYPHKSPEGGKMTIGPGFKLDSGSHGISTKTANRGMTKTRLDQEARKIGKQHLKAVDQFINYGQTTNPADTVSPQIKMGLMDLRHLVGPLNEWGNLRQAVLEGDLDRIRKESTVTWNDNGKTKVDKRRKKIRDEKYFYYE